MRSLWRRERLEHSTAHTTSDSSEAIKPVAAARGVVEDESRIPALNSAHRQRQSSDHQASSGSMSGHFPQATPERSTAHTTGDSSQTTKLAAAACHASKPPKKTTIARNEAGLRSPGRCTPSTRPTSAEAVVLGGSRECQHRSEVLRDREEIRDRTN